MERHRMDDAKSRHTGPLLIPSISMDAHATVLRVENIQGSTSRDGVSVTSAMSWQSDTSSAQDRRMRRKETNIGHSFEASGANQLIHLHAAYPGGIGSDWLTEGPPASCKRRPMGCGESQIDCGGAPQIRLSHSLQLRRRITEGYRPAWLQAHNENRSQ
jgi:hypothetical protein